MDPVTAKLMSAAGAAETATYVDDVFSTHVYVGSGSTLTINNGIDLSGEGGMVWLARRTISAGDQTLRTVDTERGGSKYVTTYSTDAEGSDASLITSFNSNGFSLGNTYANQPDDLVAWTFRKCPGFFDVVTYTGNGSSSGQTISHSLGSTPGSIWIKRTSAAEDWCVYHRSVGTAGHVRLNKTATYTTNQKFANVTSTSFKVYDSDVMINGNGDTYVAYIFAHDDQSFGDNGDEAVIKCGSFTSTGSVVDINLGFEPQWLLVKRSDTSNSWIVVDSMRGNPVGSAAQYLEPNASVAESTITGWTVPTPTGFTNNYPISGGTFIYIAIRRPHKPPQAGAEAFGISSVFAGNNVSDRHITTEGVTADLIVSKTTTSQVAGMFTDRIRGGNSLGISGTQSDADSYWSLNNWYDLDVMDGYKIGGTSYGYSNNSSHSYISYAFKRAPGFFDVVAYSGNSTSGSTVPHNLGVVPELMIIKSRNATRSWRVYDANTGTNASLKLSNDAAKDSNSAYWSTPTADNIILGTDNDTNSSSYDYIAYLFATLAGISKVGNYSGSSSNVTVDCGFTNGARFVLIKRTNGSGEWFIYDSTRGLTANTDPYLRLNNTAGQATESENWVESHSSGFKVNSTAPSDLNGSGNTYLFLAIA